MNNTKYVDEKDEFFIDAEKVSKLHTLRQETELFDDDSYVPHDIITVKRVELPKAGEDWEIFKNKQPVFMLKGIRFTKGEREFLRSVKGVLFIINGYKDGWKTISEFKRQIKKSMK